MIHYIMTYVGHYKIDNCEEFRGTILVILFEKPQ